MNEKDENHFTKKKDGPLLLTPLQHFSPKSAPLVTPSIPSMLMPLCDPSVV